MALRGSWFWLLRRGAAGCCRHERPLDLARVAERDDALAHGALRIAHGVSSVFYSWLSHVEWRKRPFLEFLHAASRSGGGNRWWNGQCDPGQPEVVAPGGAHWGSDRFARRRVSGGIRRADGSFSGAVHGGPVERRAIDRDRYFRIRSGRHAHASFFDSGGGICSGDHGHPDGAAEHGEFSARRAEF